MTKQAGFTILELLIALGIFGLVAVGTTGMIFSAISLRDQALATTRTEESLRTFNHILREAVQGAKAVTGGGNRLFLTGTSDCWSFVFDSATKNINYAEVVSVGCTPNMNPATRFFPATVQASGLVFSITPLSTGGRQVTVSGTVQTILPFSDYQTSFSNTFTNVID